MVDVIFYQFVMQLRLWFVVCRGALHWPAWRVSERLVLVVNALVSFIDNKLSRRC